MALLGLIKECVNSLEERVCVAWAIVSEAISKDSKKPSAWEGRFSDLAYALQEAAQKNPTDAKIMRQVSAFEKIDSWSKFLKVEGGSHLGVVSDSGSSDTDWYEKQKELDEERDREEDERENQRENDRIERERETRKRDDERAEKKRERDRQDWKRKCDDEDRDYRRKCDMEDRAREQQRRAEDQARRDRERVERDAKYNRTPASATTTTVVSSEEKSMFGRMMDAITGVGNSVKELNGRVSKLENGKKPEGK